MEDISDEEVKVLASNWVKRIQNSILTPTDDVRNYGVVRTCFGSNDDRMHTNHEFCEANGKIDDFNLHQPSTALIPESTNSLNFKQLPANGGGGRDVVEQCVTPFERESKQSNSAHSSKSNGERDEILTREASSNSTPRVDVASLRQKRLAFFDSKLRSQGEEDLLRDKNRNILTNIAARHSPPSEARSSSQFDSFPLSRNGLATQEPSDEMYHLQSSETPLSSPFNSGSPRNNSMRHYYKSPRSSELDEEDIKLELWGLKEAVQSGEVDLNDYLKKPAWKNRSFSNSEASHQLGQNCDLQSSEKLPRNPFDPLHEKTKPIIIPDSGGYHHSYFNSVGKQGKKMWKEIDDVDDGCFSKEFHRTSCTPVVQAGGASNSFNGPEPQINGPLYSGFETSDSESSLLSFGSKCDDVHYRKVVKKQDSPVIDKRGSQRTSGHATSKKQENKIKPKRSKDQILMELTEFIEGSGTPKDTKHSKQNNSSNDQHLKSSGDIAKIINADSLLSTVPQGHLQNGFVERADVVNLNEDLFCKTSICDKDVASSSVDCNQTNDNMVPAEDQVSRVMGKICPKCSEVNSRAANWCIECGTALICVKASCLTTHQQKNFEKQCLETQALIKETLKTPMNLSQLMSYDKAAKEERSLSDDISNLSLQVSHSTSNLEETKYSSSPRGYKRRWMRSSIAWSTYHSSELSKSPSFVREQGKMKEKKRATSFSDLMTCSSNEKGSKHKRNSRNKSARQRTVSCSSFADPDDEVVNSCERLANSKDYRSLQTTSLKGMQKEKPNGMCVQRSRPFVENRNERTSEGPYSAYPGDGMIVMESQSCPALLKSSSGSSLDGGTRSSMSQVARTIVPPLNLQDVGSYDRILTLIRSQRDSDPVPYLYLPDEILLLIFSFLPHKDLVSCSRVCWQFYRISMDESLWKVIVLGQNANITDEWLHAIGTRRPMSLTISKCRGDKITAKGLRELFRNCSDSLEELNFSRCRGGELIGESVLLHVAARCHWLKSVDASWTNVSDNGVQALVDNVKRLECLCLNGCSAVSDQSIKCVASKHGKTLRIFEVFGCFNITPAGMKILGQTCKQLQTLNIGQCYKITDTAIGCLVSNLPELENLDLRGCKQVRDSAVKKIVRHCPLITTLALANCPLITDVSLAEIATNLPRIRSLDICGCSKVTDNGICALSRNCHRLELLDLTSTGVGHKSVLSLANYCSQSLCNLKLSFCTDIYYNTVVHLAKQCKRLTTLHLYGCKRIRNASNLKLLNPALTIEC
ncbi:hypothetical protein ACROYT_G016761 [Oculina patagonica]